MSKRMIFLFLIFMLSACSEQSTKLPPQQPSEENYVIAREKVHPENFEQLAIRGTEGSFNDYYVQKAVSEEQFQELWNTFQMEGEKPDIDFTNNDAYFISFYETGYCPINPLNVQIEGSTLSFSLEEVRKDSECIAMETPKTLILKLTSSDVDNLVITERGAETQIPLK